MCHDYMDNPNEYSELQIRINWPHPSESSYGEIKSAIELNNLEPFYYEDFKALLALDFILFLLLVFYLNDIFFDWLRGVTFSISLFYE